jgi:hypothetical protein
VCYDRRAQYGRTQPRYIYKSHRVLGCQGRGQHRSIDQAQASHLPKASQRYPPHAQSVQISQATEASRRGGSARGEDDLMILVPVRCSVWYLSCTVGSSVAHKGSRASTWVIVPTPSTLDVGIRCEYKRSGDVRRSIPSFCCYPSAAILLLLSFCCHPESLLRTRGESTLPSSP